MNFFKSYFLGFKTAFTYPRMLVVTYLVNVLLALLFFFLASTLFHKLGVRSLSFEPLLKDYDIATMLEFFTNYKERFYPVFGGAIMLGILHWVLNIFLSGGILASLRLEKFSMKGFFGGAGYYFFPFLFMDLLAWGTFGLLFYGLITGSGQIAELVHPQDGAQSIGLRLLMMAVFLFFLFMCMVIITYAKVMMVVKESANFFARFFQAVFFSFGRIYVTLPLMLLLLVVPTLAVWGFYELQAMFHSSTMAGILIGLAIQQGFILVRVLLRIWTYSTHLEFYDRQFHQKNLAKKQAKLEAKKETAEKIEETTTTKTVSE